MNLSGRKYAYVTALTSTDYLDGIRTLLFSLNKVKSQYPLIVLVPTGFDGKSQQAIRNWGGVIEPVEDIALGDLAELQKRPHWSNTFLKLRVFDMTEFEKVVFIDCDMIVLENIDHLFEKHHISAVQGGKLIFRWEDINSGLMVIKPNHKEFSELVSLVPTVCRKRIEANAGFGDQDVISYYYKNINKLWDEENHLDERYNAMIRCIHELCVALGYKNIKIIHFTGDKKPWMFSFSEALKYIVYYAVHHERYRSMCALKYFCYVYIAKLKFKKAS